MGAMNHMIVSTDEVIYIVKHYPGHSYDVRAQSHNGMDPSRVL